MEHEVDGCHCHLQSSITVNALGTIKEEEKTIQTTALFIGQNTEKSPWDLKKRQWESIS